MCALQISLFPVQNRTEELDCFKRLCFLQIRHSTLAVRHLGTVEPKPFQHLKEITHLFLDIWIVNYFISYNADAFLPNVSAGTWMLPRAQQYCPFQLEHNNMLSLLHNGADSPESLLIPSSGSTVQTQGPRQPSFNYWSNFPITLASRSKYVTYFLDQHDDGHNCY